METVKALDLDAQQMPARPDDESDQLIEVDTDCDSIQSFQDVHASWSLKVLYAFKLIDQSEGEPGCHVVSDNLVPRHPATA